MIESDHERDDTFPDRFDTSNGTNVVLVIDDDPAIRDILSRVLINEGIRPVTAMNGEDGLAKAREHHPDLIILDVKMPKVDGWSVLSTLKADDDLADIPVVMQSIEDERDLGFMLGASEYLVKPVDRDRLIAMIQKYMVDGSGTVLIVDDDEPTRRAIERTLISQNMSVTHAVHGEDAIDRMREEIPAVILLDLMMPTMDGFEFLDILKSESSLASRSRRGHDRQRTDRGRPPTSRRRRRKSACQKRTRPSPFPR